MYPLLFPELLSLYRLSGDEKGKVKTWTRIFVNYV